MPLPRNNRSAADLFSGFDQLIREYVVERPRAKYREIRAKFDNLPETNFKLGREFAERGQFFDASMRFRFALYLQPNFVQAHYNLGSCYLQMGKYDKAATAFRKTLQLDPTHRQARFMLSGLAPQSMSVDQLPKSMPPEMVAGFFTQVAAEYDQLAEANQYQGPRLVVEASRPFLTKTTGLHLVDLGCGTGLIAKPWRGLCREVLGVDVTPAMVAASQVARSGDNPAYDRVLTADINAIPAGTFMPGASDVILCIDTAQFLGDLAPVCTLAAQALAPGGIFVITSEDASTPYGFGVNPQTGRFCHTNDYVRKTAAAAGLELKKDQQVAMYTGVNNHLFVFGKKAA